MSISARHMAGAAVFSALLLSTPSAFAASGYDADSRIFRLDGGDVTSAFGISPQGYLQAVYWGGQLADSDKLGPLVALRDHSSVDMSASITPQEFPGQGGGIFVEPALKVAQPDGSRDVVLKYASHSIGRDRIDVVLQDIGRPLRGRSIIRSTPIPALSAGRRRSEIATRRSSGSIRCSRRPTRCPPAMITSSIISPAAGPPNGRCKSAPSPKDRR